jgi:hypothetical protein
VFELTEEKAAARDGACVNDMSLTPFGSACHSSITFALQVLRSTADACVSSALGQMAAWHARCLPILESALPALQTGTRDHLEVTMPDFTENVERLSYSRASRSASALRELEADQAELEDLV